MECRFCSSAIKKQGLIYEDETCFVILNEYPISKGHVLVLSKKHFGDMLAVDDKTLSHCIVVAKEIASRIAETLKPTGIKLIINMDGAEELPHMHMHIIPVYGKNVELNKSYRSNRILTPETRKELLKKLG